MKGLLTAVLLLLAGFCHAQQITKAEYWVGTDPGVGLATPATISAGANTSFNFTIPGSSLTPGFYHINVRVADSDGIWGIPDSRMFYVTNVASGVDNIVGAEYFIDTDPGIGMATPLNVAVSDSSITLSQVVSVAGVAPGFHVLSVRVKDASGYWGLAQVALFYIQGVAVNDSSSAGKIVAAEYFIDTDPGAGNGSALTVSASDTSISLSQVISLSGIVAGFHQLHVRTRDAEGTWGLADARTFFIRPPDIDTGTNMPPIIAAEYFIDNDPGTGLGYPVGLNTTGFSINDTLVLDLPDSLSYGKHYIYFRTRDAGGNWSKAEKDSLFYTDDPNAPCTPAITIETNSNKVVQGDTVTFTARARNMGDNPVYQWKRNGLTIGTDSTKLSSSSLANNDVIVCTLYSSASCATPTQVNSNSITMTVVPFNSLSIIPNSKDFGNVVVTYTGTATLVIKNNGSMPVTIDSIKVPQPFSVAFTTQTLATNASTNVSIGFTPPQLLFYLDYLVVYSSAGTYTITLQGKGIAPNASWRLTSTKYDYGNDVVGTTNNRSFTIQNNGNVPVKFGTIVSNNAVFTATSNKDSIPVGESATITVSFKPVTIADYIGNITVNSASGLPALTIALSGGGYISGTPPVIELVSEFPYSGTSGVNPAVSQAGEFTYQMVYKSSTNKPPQPGYPKVGIDKNADGDFVDAGEGYYVMTKVGTTTNWMSGEIYSYTTDLTSISNKYRYKFIAKDSLGNLATTGSSLRSGPVVTNQTLDLSIFANGITFSKVNPAVGETFTVYAKVVNNTPYSASNVNVRFYNDSVYFGETTLAYIGPNSTVTVSKNLNYNLDGFYPIKVWIDSSGVLGETNQLNNYAIRPVTVGQFSVPAAINVESKATPQVCPFGVRVSGKAWYSGLNLPSNFAVLGATVDVSIYDLSGSLVATKSTYTITAGTFSVYIPLVPDNYRYSLSITDYTLTAATPQSTFNIPNVSCDGGGGPAFGGSSTPAPSVPCVVDDVNFDYRIPIKNTGTSTSYDDTIKVYANGVLSYVYTRDSIAVNTTVTYYSQFALDTGYHTLSYTHIYQDGEGNGYSDERTTGVYVYPNKPDLLLSDFNSNNVSFSVRNVNPTCVNAPATFMHIYDSLPGAVGYVLVDSVASDPVSAGHSDGLSYNFIGWTHGMHYLMLKTDGANLLSETNENNNLLYAAINVRPDLVVNNVDASNSNVYVGDSINFRAIIKNESVPATPFYVGFKVNNVQLGQKKLVNGLAYNQVLTVVSDNYAIPGDSCPKLVTAFVDYDSTITELKENNNSRNLNYGRDLTAGIPCNGLGSSCNPYVTRPGVLLNMVSRVANAGTRDANLTMVRFKLDNQLLNGTPSVNHIAAGSWQPVYVSHTFSTVGLYKIEVLADADYRYCEISEDNNIGYIWVKVIDGLPDLRVLSQHVSPSNLNPNPGQTVSVVASVENIGNKKSEPCLVRFKINGVPLGVEVPINGIFPGQDTTVAATATFTSTVVGPKIIEVRVDSSHVQEEWDTTNNAATRAVIFGAAPDLASSVNQKITFMPGTFKKGNVIKVCNYIRNYGGAAGSGYIKFFADMGNGRILIDSVALSLNHHDSIKVCANWTVPANTGKILTVIGGVNPEEFNIWNNEDSIFFAADSVTNQSQVINFPPIPSKCRYHVDFSPGAAASSGLPVIYHSDNPYVATIINGKIHITGAGTTTITASQPGSNNYTAATPVARLLTVLPGKANQTINFTPIPAKVLGNAPFIVAASSTSGEAVMFVSNDPAIATIDAVSGLITMLRPGAVTIIAKHVGNSCYNPASASRVLVIEPKSTQITFNAIPIKQYGDAAFDPGATSNSPYPIKYETSNSNIIAIANSGKAVIKGVGSVVITAYQKAGISYEAPEPVSQTVTVIKGNQFINFAPLSNRAVGTTFKAKATAPGGTVTFTSSNSSIAEIMPGNNIRCKRVGVVTITARQKGNHLYNPATLSRTLVIVPPVSRTIDSFAPAIVMKEEGFELLAYPNPFSTTLSLKFGAAASTIANVTVTDANGRNVLIKKVSVMPGTNVVQVDLSSLGQGTYLLTVEMAGELKRVTIVKVKDVLE